MIFSSAVLILYKTYRKLYNNTKTNKTLILSIYCGIIIMSYYMFGSMRNYIMGWSMKHQIVITLDEQQKI